MQTGSSLLSSTRSTRAFTAAAARSHVLRSCTRRQRSPCFIVRAENVLIFNTKGGGHAEIGLHLAKKLLSEGHSVTILNDGDQAKLEKKAPFNQYASLQKAQIVWGNPADPSTFPSEKFDVVYDNNGKDVDACKPAIDHFKGNVAHYVFVASAGAYKTNKIEPALVEGDARKESAGHVAVEKYLEEQDLPYTIFQPLYIYGPYTGKDYMRFFLDRLLRNRPVLIPSPGIQLTSLSHVEDVASLLAKVPGNAAAIRQQFNISSDRYITLDGLMKALAEAAGVEANIVHYDTKAVKLGKGEGFPFRSEHFMAIVDKAKRELGWAPTHKILDDIPELVEAYKSAGYLDADVDFSVDDKILEAIGHKVPALA